LTSAVLLLVVGGVFSLILAISSKSYFALTTIMCLPSSALTFSVFYGLWSTNDYQLFVPQNFKKVSEAVKEEDEGSCSIRIGRPQTGRDWMSLGMLVTNLVLLLIFLAAA